MVTFGIILSDQVALHPLRLPIRIQPPKDGEMRTRLCLGTYIEAIFQDNKRLRAIALKAELRNLKLEDLSIDEYFQKIESIVSVLNGLGSPLSNDGCSKVKQPRVRVFAKGSLSLEMLVKCAGVMYTASTALDMLPLILAKFGLNALNISTPSPLVAYTISIPPGFQRMAGLFPHGSAKSNGVHHKQGSSYPQQGVQTLSGPPQGVHLVPGTSQPPIQFMTGYTWHQRLGHPGSEVLRRLVSSDSISCNKEKLPVLCHACQLGKHVKLPFVSSSSFVTSCFDIVHSDLWTSPIPSLSGF
ncbi:ribonuclease H-like domain-containing protein [Tanacetum coccineum]